MDTLPFELLHLIWDFSIKTKGFISFLSTTKRMDTFKPKFIYNKSFVLYKQEYTKRPIRYIDCIYFKLEVKKSIQVHNLPKNIKKLIINNMHDKHLLFIPEGITHIKFLTNNATFIKNFFPTTLRKLKLPNFYNSPLVKDLLPNGLTHLTFGSQFNQPLLKDHIPETVTYLDLGWNYNLPLLSSIPNHVKVLKLSKMFDHTLNIGDIPSKVEILKLGRNFDQPITKGILPINLKELYFSNAFNHILPPESLPFGLKCIKFGSYYNKTILPGVIPCTVKKIIFGNDYNQPLLKGDIPEGVEWIEFGLNFTQNLDGVLPSTIKHLYVPNDL